VKGVELNTEAVAAAEENAAFNKISNTVFIAGDVLKITDEWLVPGTGRPDVIVVDPPRNGLHPKALPKIAALGARRLVYVSCKPSSLVRDLAALGELGYRVERAVCVDMFPRTEHVETVAGLSLLRPRRLRES
jgi:tRNA/tmRNA/rRNA uracil-C5-methylase (TrmA/RlmC/RlmD family)